MDLRILTFAEQPEWDRLVLGAANHSFFHCMEWAKVLAETYGYRPFFIVGREGSDAAALPLMIVRHPFSGREGISLPFSDSCGVACTRQDMLDGFYAAMIGLAEKKRLRSLLIREEIGIPDFGPQDRFFEHVITLGTDIGLLFRSLRQSTQRNIRRSESDNVTIDFSTTPESMDAYYRLHCITRKRHGVPPQSRRFFTSIHTRLISAGKGFVVRAKHRGKTVAGAVFLHHGKKALYKFGASIPDRDHVRANNLVMWKAMERLAGEGFETLSLGRTDPENTGLVQFKNGWGGECREIRYSIWPPDPHTGRKSAALSRVGTMVCRALPIPVARFIGLVLYRYAG